MDITHVVRRAGPCHHRAADPDVRGRWRGRAAFAHAALLVGSEGQIVEAAGSLGVEAMKEAGIEPIALLAKLRGSAPASRWSRSPSAEPLIEASISNLRPGAGPLRHGGACALNAPSSTSCPMRRWPTAAQGWARRTGPRSARTSKRRGRADWWEILHGHVEAAQRRGPGVPGSAAEAAERIDWSCNPWAALTARSSKAAAARERRCFLPLRRA
jgi:glutamyl-tRNA synthetase